MQLSISIEDNQLQEQITQYISNKQTNKLQNLKESATTIDFNLKGQQSYKLFQEVKDVKNYAKELRDNAWK